MLSDPRTPRVAAGIAAAAYAVLGVMVPVYGAIAYGEPAGYVIGYAFAVALVAVAVAVWTFRGRSRWGPRIVTAGALLLTIGVMAGNVMGEDGPWFAPFGIGGNLLMLAGCIVSALPFLRDGGGARAFGVLLVAYVPVSLVGAEIGGAWAGAILWGLVAAGVPSLTMRRGTAAPVAAPR